MRHEEERWDIRIRPTPCEEQRVLANGLEAEALLCLRAEEVTLERGRPEASSARNRLPAISNRLEPVSTIPRSCSGVKAG